jgi:hypothetical protein
MPTTVPYGRGAGHFIAGESNFWRSRQHETLITGQNLVAGAVVGRITASGKLTVLAPAASDGSQNPVGMLFDACDATAEDKRVVLMARDFEANGQTITWPAGISAPQKTAAVAALLALGIVVR